MLEYAAVTAYDAVSEEDGMVSHFLVFGEVPVLIEK